MAKAASSVRAAPAATVPAPASEPAPAPAPAPASEPAPAPAQLDLFDLAFAEAAAAEVEPTVKAAPAAAPAPAALPEPQPSQPQPEPPQPQPPQPEPPQPQPPPPPQPQPPPPPQPLPPQPAAHYQEPPLFNAEEATQLQTFYNDWPDVARAAETMIRGMLTQTVRRMYQDMASSLAPYLQTIDTLADRSQLSELQGQVSDYDTVSQQLSSWAARQPAYLRSAYEHVIKSGTAAEVVDLINRYKQDMQPTTPAAASAAPAASAPAPAPAPAPAVNPAIAAAAARLAPVATKRTNVVAPPTDFDTAFAEYAKAS